MEIMKYKKIYSKKVFLKLLLGGHELLWTEPNKKKPWLTVFVFKESNELLCDLTTITEE